MSRYASWHVRDASRQAPWRAVSNFLTVDELLDAEQRQGAGRDVPHTSACTCEDPCALVDPDERDR